MNVSDFLILMVEDDPNQVLLTKRALAKANLVNPLRIVSNGEQAMAYLTGKEPYTDAKENPLPSLVLLDLRLPGMGGLALLAWLRKQPALRQITVAVVTASINPRDRQRASELGVSAYLCKPIDSEGLLEMMKSLGMYWMILGKNQELPSHISAPVEAPLTSSVLLVDADRDFLVALSQGLRRRIPSIPADLAKDVDEAVGLLSKKRYQAVIVDVDSLDGDASGFIARISTGTRGARVIVLVGDDQDGQKHEALAAGAAGAVRKRLRLKECIDDLHAAIGRCQPAFAVATPSVDPPTDAPTERRALGRNDTEILGDQVRFQKTSWELVRSSGESRAMDELIRIYWKPLYYFIRQKGFDNETAKDIVQEFLADALERNTISKADPARGKFRTFLLAALSNFIKDWHKATSRLKRGGGRSTYSLDFDAGERQYALEVASGETPETVLNRAWAQSTLDECIAELRGNPTHLQAFRMMLQGARYSEISKETGLTESAAKAAVCRLRQQLRDEVLRRVGRREDQPDTTDFDIDEFSSLLR